MFSWMEKIQLEVSDLCLKPVSSLTVALLSCIYFDSDMNLIAHHFESDIMEEPIRFCSAQRYCRRRNNTAYTYFSCNHVNMKTKLLFPLLKFQISVPMHLASIFS